MKGWRNFRIGDPTEAIDSLRQQFGRLWPYYLLEEPDVWSPSDEMRRESARLLVDNYDPTVHWPVATKLLCPPYPSDSTTWLNLLYFAHSIVDPSRTDAADRVLARAATLLVVHGLEANELVSYEAVNVVGGLDEGALRFSHEAERKAARSALSIAASTIGERALRAEMLRRTSPTLDTAACDGLSKWESAAAEAEFRTIRTRALRAEESEIGTQLEHLTSQLRAFSESQVRSNTPRGAIRMRAHGTSKAASESAFRAIHAGLHAVTTHLGDRILLAPVTLAQGSVGVVCRLEGNGDATDEDGNIRHDENVVASFDRILAPGSEELIPLEIGQLIGELWDTRLELDIELWTPNGGVNRTEISRERLDKVRSAKRTRAMAIIKSIDVPQADDLKKVFYAAERSEQGEDVKETGIPGVVKRQWDYYRHAARILGLITPLATITPSGLQLVRTSDLNERLCRAAFLFEASVVGQAWLEWSNATSVRELSTDRTRARAFVEERTQSGGSTVGRRADCLVHWLESFREALGEP